MKSPEPSTSPALSDLDQLGLATAIAEARKSYQEGGIPVGAALVQHGGSDTPGVFLGAAHNVRIQKASPTLHAEIATLEDAGRLGASVYRKSTMYTTLSPCSMCTGAILLYKIPRVVVGENTTFLGGEALLRQHGVQVIVVDDPECKALMERYIKEKPEDWNEDIGE